MYQEQRLLNRGTIYEIINANYWPRLWSLSLSI